MSILQGLVWIYDTDLEETEETEETFSLANLKET